MNPPVLFHGGPFHGVGWNGPTPEPGAIVVMRGTAKDGRRVEARYAASLDATIFIYQEVTA